MTVKICLQLSQDNFFLMIGSLEVMHEIIFTIPSVIQISSINSIRLNIGKPRMNSVVLCAVSNRISCLDVLFSFKDIFPSTFLYLLSTYVNCINIPHI